MQRLGSFAVQPLADRIGIAGSLICAVHCLAAPLLLLAGPVLSASFLADEAFHHMLLWAIAPAAIVAFGLGCWTHKDGMVMAMGLAGLIGIIASVALPHELLGEIGEKLLTVGATGLLIAAHLRNFKKCRAVACHHEQASS